LKVENFILARQATGMNISVKTLADIDFKNWFSWLVSPADWSEWSDEAIFKKIKDHIGRPGVPIADTYHEQFLSVEFKFDNYSTATADLNCYILRTLKIYNEFKKENGDDINFDSTDSAITKALIAFIDDKKNTKSARKRLHDEVRIKSPTSIPLFLRNLSDIAYEIIKAYELILKCGLSNSFKENSDKNVSEEENNPSSTKKHFLNKKQGFLPYKKQKVSEGNNEIPSNQCYMCGRNGHAGSECKNASHPHSNKNPSKRWIDTEIGKKYQTLDNSYKVLPFDKVISKDGKKLNQYDPNFKNKFVNKKEGMNVLSSILSSYSNDFTTVFYLQTRDNKSKAVHVLLDTGALTGDYISDEIAEYLSLHSQYFTPCNVNILSVFKDTCSNCTFQTNCNLTFKNELTHENELLSINAKVINSVFDVIIGRGTITQYGLLDKLRSKFLSPEILQYHRARLTRQIAGLGDVTPIVGTILTVPIEFIGNIFMGEPKDKTVVLKQQLSTEKRKMIVPSSSIRDKSTALPSSYWFPNAPAAEDVFGNEPDISEYLNDNTDNNKSNDEEEKIKELLSSITISGTPELRKELSDLCREYHDIFSLSLKETSAEVEKMHLQVDDKLWRIPRNQEGARPLSFKLQKELETQVQELLQKKIIRPSNATYHSQVVFVPKPDGSWRFCVDYRYLNSVTKKLGWPLPNISMILQRIGHQRPKYFGIMDLTKGYFQTEMDEDSKQYSAFTTHQGKYEWNRVAMGLTGAPSYFQMQIGKSVLRDLLGTICELYIDDIITYASSEKEFVDRLRKIFQRLRETNVILHPSKCKFGMDQVKYLGHKIDSNGLSMMEDRIQKVIDFPKPKTQKQLKSFLGVVNYFHPFIRNQSSVVRPMQLLVRNYKKSKVIEWTEEAEKAFDEVKERIFQCPKLYFINDYDEIFLSTDASDYGIGAYLYQQVNDKEYPIGFISKALISHQLNWSTIEKECYSIFYAVKYWHHLLQDRRFTLKTDHRNLTYVSNASSNKVINWKLAIQEYKFDCIHVPGVDNVVADFLSRYPAQCEIQNNTEIATVIREHTDTISAEGINEISFNDTSEFLCHIIDEYQYTEDQRKLIATHHNSNVGHFGVDKVVKELQFQGHTWKYMRYHVARFIKKCPCCQKMAILKPVIHTMPFTTSSYEPMQVLNIDTVGPFPESTHGYKYILVLVDCFTRFVDLIPTRENTAEEAAKAILQHVGRYATPSAIQTDRGSEFVNKINDVLSNLMSTERVLTLAYSKEENSIVERSNREVQRHLKAIMYDVNIKERWMELIPLVQRIMNTMKREELGVSPSQLLFGNSAQVDRRILFEDSYDKDKVSTDLKLSKWVDEMLNKQSLILKVAKEKQELVNEQNITDRTPETITEFPINSYVLIQYPRNAMGRRPPSKLNTLWKGPFRVANFIGSKYTVQNLVTNDYEDVHVTSLKAFEYDPKITDPVLVANKDAQMFNVEKILDHRNVSNRITSYEFLVRWEGHGPEYDEWLKWSQLRLNIKLHAYLETHNLKTFIPNTVDKPKITRKNKKKKNKK
jgi:hypothetical protein